MTFELVSREEQDLDRECEERKVASDSGNSVCKGRELCLAYWELCKQ